MNSRLNRIPAFSLLLALVPLAASATPTLWPANGHYYEVIANPGIIWVDAQAAAGGMTHLGAAGHLATITSATEDAFIEGLRAAAGISPPEVWVGGYQVLPCTPMPNCGWTWLNGEGPFVYMNWQGGEPNDNGGEEQYLGVGLGNTPGWNDERVLGNIGGYIVEYSDYQTDAVDDFAAADSGETISIDVLTNDTVDTGVASVTIESAPTSGGTAVVNGMSIDYKSGAGFGGMDTFAYRVTANNGLSDTAIVTVDVSTTVSVVVPGINQLFFNQANVPGSDNPLTAAYQEVLAPGEVSISCCRVLDTREGAGLEKHGYFLRTTLDLGLAVANTALNPSCVDMPAIAAGTAKLTKWQRGIPTSRGIDDPGSLLIARENDLGVCAIQANIVSKGVVFSEEDARNVLGYSVNCAEPNISYRPFAGGVTTSLPKEVDEPNVTTWTAECDETRSAKRYSDNILVLNMRHDTKISSTVLYLLNLKYQTWKSIGAVKAEGCVDNSAGFLDDLLRLTEGAGANILLRRGEAAVQLLDDATRLALLIGPDAPVTDPYGVGLSACPDNPKGLFVGRLMALKFATCSELVQAGAGENSQAPAACAIAGDILSALPPLTAP